MDVIYAATSADGYMYPSGAQKCSSTVANGQTTNVCNSPAWAFDARMNAPIGTAFNTTTTVTGNGTNNTSTTRGYTGFVYDSAGRRLGSTAQSGVQGSFATVDVENFTRRSLDNTTTYAWGADHHLNSSYLASGGQLTLHWDGDTLLFTTNATGQLAQINITRDAMIMPSTKQLSITDRDPFGVVVSTRNSTGSDALIVANPYASCDDAASTPKVLRGATSGYTPSYSLCHSNGTIYTKPRPDGYYDGITMFKGLRSYDATAMAWTSPDAVGGNGGAPLNQLAYGYANNNPISFSDPSGLAVWLNTNPVAQTGGVADHLYLQIIPDNPSDFIGDSHFYDPDDPSKGATISGEPACANCELNFGNLVSMPNYDIHDPLNNNAKLVTPPGGMNDSDFILSLFQADDTYRNNENGPNALLYWPTGLSGGLYGKSSYNSNGYATGILHATGGNIEDNFSHSGNIQNNFGTSWTPGSDLPVPDSYFGA